METKKTVLSNRYELIEQVGVGGMSYVYKAYDLKTKKIVAIKELKDDLVDDVEFVNKFEQEAIASKSIKHKNVVSANDVVHDGKIYYIVLEFADGITLNKYIKEKGHLSNEETIDIAIQIASGLESAHKKGIIHRDVKPQNIVICKNRVAKIMDFGIARAITSNTKNISVIGSVHYISPEQAKNEDLDFRSDIYSLGCTMYEMITGKIPFEGDQVVSIIMSHIRENIKNPSVENKNIYKSLEKIILKATKRNPDERYQNIEELISDLKKALKDKEGSFISNNVYEEDDLSKTLIISDNQMQMIKKLSSKYQNTKEVNENDFSENDKLFVKKLRSSNKRNISTSKYIWMIVLFITIAIGIIVAGIIAYQFFDTLKYRAPVSTTSQVKQNDKDIILKNIYRKLIGMDVDEARELTKDYGIMIVSSDKEFNDEYDYNQIVSVKNDNDEDSSVLEVVISKGSEILDFTDIKKLNETKFSNYVKMLEERNLQYTVIESDDRYIERGNIIGVNKKKSSEKGQLIFTISTGTSKDIVNMPDLKGLTIDGARELLQTKNLALGEIYYNREASVEAGLVISQSIQKFEDVKIGTAVDIVISSGENGEITEMPFKEHWIAELNQSYIVSRNNAPGGNNDDSIVISVRLMQITDTGIKYYELSQPAEYRIGTTMSLVYLDIEGEKGIYNGEVQVVDVENDIVLKSFDVQFKQVMK